MREAGLASSSEALAAFRLDVLLFDSLTGLLGALFGVILRIVLGFGFVQLGKLFGAGRFESGGNFFDLFGR